MARYRYTGPERVIFHRRRYPGEVAELSEAQAAQWPGAFARIEPPPPEAPDEDLASIVAGAAVSDILEAVRAGILNAAEVLAAERAGKSRVTLIRALQGA